MKLFFGVVVFVSALFAEPIDEFVKSLEQEVQKKQSSFQGFSVQRGEQIFTTEHIGKKGKKISCVSCHTSDFTQKGEHFFTGKAIEPLSRKTNPEAMTDVRNVQKWLRRNFKDVYNRLGTPKEQGDVLVYMLSKAR